MDKYIFFKETNGVQYAILVPNKQINFPEYKEYEFNLKTFKDD